VRLPGSGGAPEIAVSSRRVFVVAAHSPRVFVDRLDFVTSGAQGVTAVITDLGVLGRDRASGELVLTALHPGVGVDEVRAATGWPLRVADELSVSSPPAPGELEALRALVARGEFAA
jgi:acyl CoA:acetate/3-ketoacid CoA transferase beta subunit